MHHRLVLKDLAIELILHLVLSSANKEITHSFRNGVPEVADDQFIVGVHSGSEFFGKDLLRVSWLLVGFLLLLLLLLLLLDSRLLLVGVGILISYFRVLFRDDACFAGEVLGIVGEDVAEF